jgi:hypothetical protein
MNLNKFTKILAYLILFFTIGSNAWLNFPETKILADPNDNVFQYALVYRTNWIWHNYNCPLSLACFPNLTDHLVPSWAEGYSLPFYYSHLPQITIVATYNLIARPLTSLLGINYSLFEYYTLTKYLLLILFPIPVFLALRLVGFSPLAGAVGAFFAANFSTDGLYGIDPPSFLWRGYGLTSQLYAMFFLPLGLAFTFRAVRENKKFEARSTKHETNSNNINSKFRNSFQIIGFRILRFVSSFEIRISNLPLAILFLSLTTAGHLGIGMIGLISTIPFLFLDANITNIVARGKRLFVIYAITLFSLAYWIIPILLNDGYHIISFWDPLWKFNSYGASEVVRQFIQGEIFDWKRVPIVTGLVTVGFLITVLDTSLFPFAVLFVMWMLLYFGRTTWGGLIDLVPGMKDFHLHRFVVGVHIAGIFLIPAAFEKIKEWSDKFFRFLIGFFPKYQESAWMKNIGQAIKNSIQTGTDDIQNKEVPTPAPSEIEHSKSHRIITSNKIVPYISLFLVLVIFSFLGYLAVKQTVSYAQPNNLWIAQANTAFTNDENNFHKLLARLKQLPPGRVYAGRPGNWGNSFRLGSTQIYMLLGVYGVDITQFLPETWSPLSENDQNFDERVPSDYDLLNTRYIVAPKDEGFPPQAKLDSTFGPFQLYIVPTTGWFDVVTSPMLVKTDKTNFVNIVHVWHRSYPRQWKMYPLISVEKNPDIPAGTRRVIQMKDVATFEENGQKSNIFTDFPFVFPEATVSGKIVNEHVEKQTYQATVEVPENCVSCMVMFKMSYHPNWQVKVDGMDTKKYAVFPFYLAAPLTPGTHTVEFIHYPNKLKVILIVLEIITGIIFLFRKRLMKLIS